MEYNIPLQINNTKLNELYDKYNSISKEAQEKWESQYKHIDGYEAYVYLITDVKYNMYYIGVRYTPYKHNTDLLEDLKQYQSSSTDEVFKNRQITDSNNFTYTILKSFNNELDAKNYEALLHQIYNVSEHPQFYNKTNANFIEHKVYFTPLWDLIEEKEVFYKDIKDSNITYSDIYSLVIHKYEMSKYRYCLLEHKDKTKILFDYYNTQTDLYIFANNVVKHIKVKNKDGCSIVGPRYNLLLNKTQVSANGYYLDAHLCKLHNTLISLYKFDYTKNIVIKHEIMYKDGSVIVGVNFTKLINNKLNFTNGYYTSESLCMLHHSIINLYTFDDIHNCIKMISIMYKDGSKLIGEDVYLLFNGTKNIYKGYTLNKEILLDMYEIHILYTWDNEECIEHNIIFKDGCNIVGPAFTRLIKVSNINSYNGWYTSREYCISQNKKYDVLHVDTNIKLKLNKQQCKEIIGVSYTQLLYNPHPDRVRNGYKLLL